MEDTQKPERENEVPTPLKMTIEEHEEHCMLKYGFIMHLVQDAKGVNSYNLHTHGLKHGYNHPDFQIVMKMPPEVGGSLMHLMVKKVVEGAVFTVDTEYSDILSDGYKVKFIKAIENDREVLRLILPDKMGELEESKLQPGPFKDQFFD